MIKFIQVFGPRCSGTNFVVHLVNNNFVGVHIWEKNWKHTHVTPAMIAKYGNLDKWLFIVVHRDIYDWIRSFFLQPHHVPPENRKSFHDFIHNEWWCWYDEWAFYPAINSADPRYHKERPDDNDPSGSRHANVFQMRNRKQELYLELKNFAPNVFYIDLDHCKKNFREVLQQMAQKYNLKLRPEIHDVNVYKGFAHIPYKKREYTRLTEEEREWINSQKNERLEQLLGSPTELNS